MSKNHANNNKPPKRPKRFRLPRIPRARGALAGSPPGGNRLLQL